MEFERMDVYLCVLKTIVYAIRWWDITIKIRPERKRRGRKYLYVWEIPIIFITKEITYFTNIYKAA